MSEPLRSRRDYGSREWVTQEEMREMCPKCADKMVEKGIKRIDASLVEVALEKGRRSR